MVVCATPADELACKRHPEPVPRDRRLVKITPRTLRGDNVMFSIARNRFQSF